MSKRVFIIAMAFLCFNSAKAQPSKNAEAVYHQGVAFAAKEKYQEAMVSFFKAVKLYKDYDSAYVMMGDINTKFNSYDTAMKFYKKALAINPKNVRALNNLATIYKNVEHNTNDALACYLKIIAIDSTNKEIFVFAAWCYNTLQHYDKAIPYAVKALDIDGNYRAAYGELGHSYHMSGKYAEGVEQFKKNIAVSHHEMPMFYAGLCYIELKDKVGANSMVDELTKISSKLAETLKKRIEKMEN